ncbi:MAG: CotH kinase family protein [Muribaculaceae bacterium]|nr:CotH kinase family protein [Muribaculaceae bacterium]
MRKIFSMALLAALGLSASAQIRINEVMQSNIDGLYVDGDFPDSWIELKNTGSVDVDLKGWGVSVKDKYKKAYVINESCIVAPGGFVVLYCDKEDKGLHTDFRVDSGESSVYLWNPSGELAEEMKLAKMPAPEISYGVTTEGGLGYFVTATPGAENVSVVSDVLLPNPEISPVGGVFSSPVTVTVQLPADARLPEGAVLCVTTDGSEPTMKDAVPGTIWTQVADTTAIIRAKVISEKMLSGRSVSMSYIFHPRELNLPVISIMTDSEYLYGEEIGIITGGPEDNPNYLYDYRRPVNVEYYETDGAMKVNQLGEMRIQGGATRVNPQKSFAIYANKRFGEKKFDCSTFWPDKPQVKKCKSFILRNSGNDYQGAHISDAYVQTMLGRGMENVDFQAYRPVVAYINGQYYGLIDLRERTNDDWVEANCDGLEDIDMIENFEEVKVGDGEAVFDLLNLMGNPDLSFEEVAKILDMDNFSSNMAMALYTCFSDWNGNNTVLWRNVLEGADNRWRLITKDFDHSIGKYGELPSKNHFPYFKDFAATSDPVERRISHLYNFWLKNEEGQKMIADKVSFFVGDFMSPERAIQQFKEMTEELRPEMYDTYGVLSTPGVQNFNYSYWLEMIGDDARYQTFLRERPNYIFEQIRDEFGYGRIYDLEVDHENLGASINGMKFTCSDYKTKYFTGEKMTLSAVENKAWKAVQTLDNGKTVETVFPSGVIEYEAAEDVVKVEFTLVDSNSVEGIIDAGFGRPVNYYTIDGLRLDAEPTENGIYIRRQGNKADKIILNR